MSFRINNITISKEFLSTDTIQLVDENKDNQNNYFSLLVGNNGTGKSHILKSIVDYFRQSKNNRGIYMHNTMPPTKVIAMTNSISDKFPSTNPQTFANQFYKEQKYNYLGTKAGLYSSPQLLMKRAMDIFIEYYSNKNISTCYRRIFDYLDYHPFLELTYKKNRRSPNHYPRLNDNPLTPADLEEFIYYKKIPSTREYLLDSQLEKYHQAKKKNFPEICDFYNEKFNNSGEPFKIALDFSQDKIQKINEDDSEYKYGLKVYEMLDYLRYIGLIGNAEVSVAKKTSGIFRFNDASSGEANILVNMISLIPLLQDNCCVLIDEPEISLHPTWQYRYIELLQNVFSYFKGCHIIIASHSHFIVSDLPVNGSSVTTLKIEKNKVVSQLLPNSTFGWSAEDILLNIFDMPTSRNYYLSNMLSEILELIGTGEIQTKRFRELVQQLRSFAPNMKKDDPLLQVVNTILNSEIAGYERKN